MNVRSRLNVLSSRASDVYMTIQKLEAEIERLNRKNAANTNMYVAKRVNLVTRLQKEQQSQANIGRNSGVLLRQMARNQKQPFVNALKEHILRRRHMVKVIYRTLRNWRHRPGGPVYQRLIGEVQELVPNRRPRPRVTYESPELNSMERRF